jgi:hypothetical protein
MFASFSAIIGLYLLAATSAGAEVDLADGPLFTRIQPPPADIMVVLDESSGTVYL